MDRNRTPWSQGGRAQAKGRGHRGRGYGRGGGSGSGPRSLPYRNGNHQHSTTGFQAPGAQSLAQQQSMVQEMCIDLPGELSRFGPRHDNDHSLIQEIQILPTLSEILNEGRPEFLPTRLHRHHQTGIRRLLDSQFRLLREDTCGLLRDSIRLVLKYWRIFAQNPDWTLKRKLLREKSPTPARIFTNASIQRLRADEFKGIVLDIEFDQIDRLRSLTPSQRGRWWWDSGALKERGQIVVLIDGEQTNETANVIFLLVSHREVSNTCYQSHRQAASRPTIVCDVNSNADRASATFRLANPSCISDVPHLVSSTRLLSKSSKPLMLLEFPAIMYRSFEGVLRCLQTVHLKPTDMPFINWLVAQDELHEATNSPTAKQGLDAEIAVSPPRYLRKHMALDLSCLPRPATNHTTITSSLMLPLTHNPFIVSTKLSEETTLDPDQAAALVLALQRELALIQGPPGTGKSYVGAQIAKVLLHNRELLHIGPIVCVCYTNHALDQFLNDLLDSGVSDIARVGPQTVSPRLEKFSLEYLKKAVPKRRAGAIQTKLNACKGQLIELSAKIEHLCSAIKSCNKTTVGRHLKRVFPTHSEYLVNNLPEQEYDKRINDWLSGGAQGASHRNGMQRTIQQLIEANIWTLRHNERARLYEHWRESVIMELATDLTNLLQQHYSVKERYTSIFSEVDREILSEAQVVGVTTTGLANNSDIIRGLTAKVLICEEAGEVLESHILTALLPSIEHLIMIGDHMQLRPRISNKILSKECDKRCPSYNLDESLFERLATSSFSVINQSGPEGRLTTELRFPTSQLHYQRRMDPSIASLIRETLYPNLMDHFSTKCYPAVSGLRRRLFWLDHQYLEDASDLAEPMQSKTNSQEAEMVTALVRHICRQGTYKSGEIAVLTPYVGQLRKLKGMLESEVGLIIEQRDCESLEELDYMNFQFKNRKSTTGGKFEGGQCPRRTNTLQNLRLATIDNFQGEEATVVIISLVRSNQNQDCGFLKCPNRINVLLSRAKHGMYIIGDASTAATAPMWASIIERFKKHGNIGQMLELSCERHPEKTILVSRPSDFLVHSPEGGCDENCDLRLECGHRCKAKCHSETQHNTVKCKQPCIRTRSCGHKCRGKCHQPCGECRVFVSNVVLPCGHILDKVECRQLNHLLTTPCERLIIRNMPNCQHTIKVPCYQDSSELKCQQLCGGMLPCGHTCQRLCWECRTIPMSDGQAEHGPCTNRCGKLYRTCSHACDNLCHPGTTCPPCDKQCEIRCKHSRCPKKCRDPCAPCAEPCGWVCIHRDMCNLPCSVPCDVNPCNHRCWKKLKPCGHPCPGVCGELCPDSRFCHVCCKTDIKKRIVDLIEFKEYHVIDPDKDPLIFLTCGHFYTLASLDGSMGMANYFIIDEFNGSIKRPTSTPWVANSEDSLKGCPECRVPLYSIDRYNRIVKRDLLNDAARRFVTQAHDNHMKLLKDLESIESNMDLEREAFLSALSSAHGRQRSLIEFENSLENYQKRGMKLHYKINGFIKSVAATEQPFARLKELLTSAVAEHKAKSGQKLTSFKTDELVIQSGFQLYGQSMSLRLSWAMLWDMHLISNNSSVDSRVSHVLRQVISTRTNILLNKCKSLLHSSQKARFRVEEVRARIFHAQFLILSLINQQEQKLPMSLASEESAREAARQTLDESESLCLHYPGTLGFLRNDIEKARKLLNGVVFYSFVTTEETRDVYRAMAEQFSGTGHWYYCANNHPFTVGDCGMPMEQARCPQCGEPVGGQDHEFVEGVTRAIDMDNDYAQ